MLNIKDKDIDSKKDEIVELQNNQNIIQDDFKNKITSLKSYA